MRMNSTAIFTIASKNYLAYVRTLLQSVHEHHADVDCYCFLADEIQGELDPVLENYSLVEARDLGIPDFISMTFKYDIVEFNTAIKPFSFKYLLEKGYEKIIYFDPDIMLFSSAEPLLALLERHPILLTPHITRPIPAGDSFRPSERSHLISGTYNLGFIAISSCDAAREFIEWWSLRCAEACYIEPETGIFVDQKWINHVPGLFPDVCILRHPGCNMAYWNLHERQLDGLTVNGEYPLIFYHFSGINTDDLEVLSKHQEKYSLTMRTDLQAVFEEYRSRLLANGHEQTRRFKYAYALYSNGESIGGVARRLYDECSEKYTNPFSTDPGSYYHLLRRNSLLEKERYTLSDRGSVSEKASKINILFRIARNLLGVDRYVLLLKYLNYVTVLRRQGFLLK